MLLRNIATQIRTPLFLVGSLLVTLLVGCGGPTNTRSPQSLLTPAVMPATAIENQYPLNTPDIAKGAATYSIKCQACHGVTGRGDGPRAAEVKVQGGLVADLVGASGVNTAKLADWFDTVKNGRLDHLMPGFSQSLSAQNIWDVIGYVWALGTDLQAIDRGQSQYLSQCAQCHGTTGKGDGPQAAGTLLTNLASGPYLADNSLMNVTQAMISGTVHQQVKLDDDQRVEVAGYIRSLAIPYVDATKLAKNTLTGDGLIQVQAVNGTPDGGRVVNIPVTLRVYDTNGEILTRTAMLDKDSVSTFADLPRNSNLFLQAEITYKGAKFYASPQQFTETQQVSVTLPVYEVTNDPAVLAISSYHFFVQDVGEGTLAVVEVYVFDNNSNQAYMSNPSPDGQLRSVQVTVPAEASNLHFDGPGIGARFSLDNSTLYDGDAVPPGHNSSSIVMLYNLPYRSGKRIEQQVFYTVRSWDVILPDNVMRVADMTDKGLQAISTSSVRLYVPANSTVPAGGKLAFTLVGQPRTAIVQGEDGRAIGIGLVSIVLAGALAFLFYSRVRSGKSVETELETEKDEILREIANLDTEYGAGKVKEENYRRQRDELKEDLREIW